MANKNQKNPATTGEIYNNQISVLKVLSKNTIIQSEPRALHINDISEMSGLRDEKETQRYLFILEGQKLVAPSPAGDFTSKNWHITRDGLRAMKKVNNLSVQ